MDDWAPPTQRLTYGVVTNAMRGLALFFSLHGYFEVDFDINDEMAGHVGSGTVAEGGKVRTSR